MNPGRSQRPHFLRQSSFGVAALAVCLAVGWVSYEVAAARTERSQVAAASQGLASFTVALNSLLERHEVLPRLLALDPRLTGPLRAPRDAALAHSASLLLEKVAAHGQLSAAYLIDAGGNTIAASNWNTRLSFVGHNYAFRSYFTEAVSRGFGRLYAIGATSGEPGYFLAARVAEHGRTLGVVVVKVDLRTLQAAAGDGDLVSVVDDRGVVILSSEPSLLYRPVEPASGQALEAIRQTRRYGRQPLVPLKSPEAARETGEAFGLVHGHAGRRYRQVAQPVATPGWQAMSFVRIDDVRQVGGLAAAGGAAAAGFLIALGLYVQLKRRRAVEVLRSRNALRRSEMRLRAVADKLPVMVCFVDPALRYVFANTLYAQMYGTTSAAIEGQPVSQVLDPQEFAAVRPHLERALRGETITFEREYRHLRAYRCYEATYQPEWDAQGLEVTGVHAMTQEITETKRKLAELDRLSQLDHLTQLLNRKGFDAALQAAIEGAVQSGGVLALLFIDLDGFKPVNDRHGHPVGDAVLRAFSKRLSRLVRENDAVARLGGDEFAVVIPGLADADIAERLAAGIVRAASTPFDIDGVSVRIGASVGGVLEAATAATTADALCARADARLYEAKRAGKGAHRLETAVSA